MKFPSEVPKSFAKSLPILPKSIIFALLKIAII